MDDNEFEDLGLNYPFTDVGPRTTHPEHTRTTSTRTVSTRRRTSSPTDDLNGTSVIKESRDQWTRDTGTRVRSVGYFGQTDV